MPPPAADTPSSPDLGLPTVDWSRLRSSTKGPLPLHNAGVIINGHQGHPEAANVPNNEVQAAHGAPPLHDTNVVINGHQQVQDVPNTEVQAAHGALPLQDTDAVVNGQQGRQEAENVADDEAQAARGALPLQDTGVVVNDHQQIQDVPENGAQVAPGLPLQGIGGQQEVRDVPEHRPQAAPSPPREPRILPCRVVGWLAQGFILVVIVGWILWWCIPTNHPSALLNSGRLALVQQHSEQVEGAWSHTGPPCAGQQLLEPESIGKEFKDECMKLDRRATELDNFLMTKLSPQIQLTMETGRSSDLASVRRHTDGAWHDTKALVKALDRCHEWTQSSTKNAGDALSGMSQRVRELDGNPKGLVSLILGPWMHQKRINTYHRLRHCHRAYSNIVAPLQQLQDDLHVEQTRYKAFQQALEKLGTDIRTAEDAFKNKPAVSLDTFQARRMIEPVEACFRRGIYAATMGTPQQEAFESYYSDSKHRKSWSSWVCWALTPMARRLHNALYGSPPIAGQIPG